MTSSAALQPDNSPIRACTVARDVQNFDLLIEDMETELGEGWGDLNFADATAYLGQPEAASLEFIAIAVDNEDNEDEALLSTIGDLITRTKEGVIMPVHGLAGGVGSSTFAVNLAWELATVDKKRTPKVCLLDLDFQFGSTSTYLDLPRRDAVYEMLSDMENTDDEAFKQTLLTFNDKISVLTAPSDILPLDLVSAEDIERLVTLAQRNFDFVIIDMPTTLVQWTEVILGMSQVYFGMLELDLRSAQNALRLIRALKAEDLPHEKIRYALNRAPKFTDMASKSRAKRMAESLDIDLSLHLPDGGKQVPQSCDHGLPIAETAAKNPLRREISKLAQSLIDIELVEETA